MKKYLEQLTQKKLIKMTGIAKAAAKLFNEGGLFGDEHGGYFGGSQIEQRRYLPLFFKQK